MQIKIRDLFVVSLLALAPASTGFAAEIPGLREFLRNQLNVTSVELNADVPNARVADGTEAFYFRRIWLRLRPQVTFTVPVMAHIQIVPEVEILFERQLPSGWAVYKP